jgi:exosome complex exonuclease DIS3/RRP44
VVLLTNDRGNLKRAKEEGIDALSVRQFAADHAGSAPELADVVAANAIEGDGDGDDGMDGGDGGRGGAGGSGGGGGEAGGALAKRAKVGGGGGARGKIFAEHLGASAVAAGVKGGTLHQAGLALFTLFSPELGLWVGTCHVILQSKHQSMKASTVHVNQSDTRE